MATTEGYESVDESEPKQNGEELDVFDPKF